MASTTSSVVALQLGVPSRGGVGALLPRAAALGRAHAATGLEEGVSVYAGSENTYPAAPSVPSRQAVRCSAACADRPAGTDRRIELQHRGAGALRDISNVTLQPTSHDSSYVSAKTCLQPSSLVSGNRWRDSVESECNDPAAEYLSDLWDSLFRKESSCMAKADYMECQLDLNGEMRAILVDWLVEVHFTFKLRSETLFLAVNLVDRYLSRVAVKRTRLQLVGVVGFFIAAKFEEVNPPSAESLASLTDGAYTVSEIFALECKFLSTLGFQVLAPTATSFLDNLCSSGLIDQTERELSQYMLELSLVDLRMIRYEPSRLVAAALLLSGELTAKRAGWVAFVSQNLRHSEVSSKKCAEELRALLLAASASTLRAVQKKHPQFKYLRVPRSSLAAGA